MFVGLGTVINLLTIIFGCAIGIALGGRLPKKWQKMITDILGLITILGATSALIPLWSSQFKDSLPNGSPLLLVLASMLIGGLLGTALKIEQRVESFGENLRKRFKASSDSPFVEGFVSASLLFVIGPLAILGSVSDGIRINSRHRRDGIHNSGRNLSRLLDGHRFLRRLSSRAVSN